MIIYLGRKQLRGHFKSTSSDMIHIKERRAINKNYVRNIYPGFWIWPAIHHYRLCESLHLSGPHWYGFAQQFSTWVSHVKSKEVLVAGVQSEAEVEQRETSLLHLIQQPQTRVLKEDQVWWLPGPEDGIWLENSEWREGWDNRMR